MSKKIASLNKDELKKLASIDQRDAEKAFEVGFVKAATDLGMNQEEFREFHRIACQDLAASVKR